MLVTHCGSWLGNILLTGYFSPLYYSVSLHLPSILHVLDSQCKSRYFCFRVAEGRVTKLTVTTRKQIFRTGFWGWITHWADGRQSSNNSWQATASQWLRLPLVQWKVMHRQQANATALIFEKYSSKGNTRTVALDDCYKRSLMCERKSIAAECL